MASAGRDPRGIVTRLAGATVNFNRFVKKGATDAKVIQAAAATDKGYGVSLPDLKKTSYAADDILPVATRGVVNVEAGAAVAVQDRLTSDSVGRAVKAASLVGTVDSSTTDVSTTQNVTFTGSQLPEGTYGVALTAAAQAGDIIEVALEVK